MVVLMIFPVIFQSWTSECWLLEDRGRNKDRRIGRGITRSWSLAWTCGHMHWPI